MVFRQSSKEVAAVVLGFFLIGWMQNRGVNAHLEGSFGFIFKPTGHRCSASEVRAIYVIAELVGEHFGYRGASYDDKWLNKQELLDQLDKQDGLDDITTRDRGTPTGDRGGRELEHPEQEHEEEEQEETNGRDLGTSCNDCDWWLTATQNVGEYGDCCKCCIYRRRRNLREITRQLQNDMEKLAADYCEVANIPCIVCQTAVFREF